MSDKLKLLRNITKDFKEVQTLLDEHKKLKKRIRTVDRKLKTIETKYNFLTDITSIDGTGIVIEIAAKKLFKSAGFKDVRHLQNAKPQREDLQIWDNDCIIIVECKGIKNSIPQDNDIGQVKKYVDYRVNKLKNELPIFGLTLINHDNSKPRYKRNKNPIDRNKNEYAIAGQYGVVTSLELVNGFLLLKNNNITLEQFKKTITQYGVIKF